MIACSTYYDENKLHKIFGHGCDDPDINILINDAFKEKKTIDLSFNKVHNLSNPKLEILDLSNNKISDIVNGPFKEIKKLDMSYNKINNISNPIL